MHGNRSGIMPVREGREHQVPPMWRRDLSVRKAMAMASTRPGDRNSAAELVDTGINDDDWIGRLKDMLLPRG